MLSFSVGDISGDFGESGEDIPFSLQKKNIRLDLCVFFYSSQLWFAKLEFHHHYLADGAATYGVSNRAIADLTLLLEAILLPTSL